MKHLIAASLYAGSASAVQVQFLEAPIQTFYQSAEQCDELPHVPGIFHYEFNQDACGCWIVYEMEDFPTCLEPTPLFNPYSSPFIWSQFCVR